MVSYSIIQSEKVVSKAYLQLMGRLSAHVTLLAKEGKPFTSFMGIKRNLYRFKRQLTQLPFVPPEGGIVGSISIGEDLALLIGNVLDKFDLDVLEAVELGLIGERDLKRVLIMHDYKQMAEQGIKHKDIKKLLSERYGWSVSSIEKLVYGKSKR